MSRKERETMKVSIIALEDAFYGGVRIRAGREYVIEVDDSKDRTAEDYLPSWAMSNTEGSREIYEALQRCNEKAFRDAAIASSGTKYAERKKVSFVDAMATGSARDAKAEAAARAASGDVGSKKKKTELEQYAVADLPIPHGAAK